MPVAAPIIPESEPIKVLIGDAAASAALAILEGARICIANGGQLSPATKAKSKAGGSYIAMLVELQRCAPELNFEQVAREWGTRALKKRINGHGYFPAVTGDMLIDDVIIAVRQVTTLVAAMDEADKVPLSS
jgi:hypothetical protein